MKITILLIALCVAGFIESAGHPSTAYGLITIALIEYFYEEFWLKNRIKELATSVASVIAITVVIYFLAVTLRA